MSAIRVVHVPGTEVVTIVDEATGLIEVVDVSAIEADREVDTVIEDQPEVSSRRYFTP